MLGDLLLEVGFASPLPLRRGGWFSRGVPLLGRKLGDAGFSHAGIDAFSTPRRYALLVRQLADPPGNGDVPVIGPPARVAFDSVGVPTQAATNFATKSGVSVSELFVVERREGSFVAARSPASSLSGLELLGSLLRDFCEALFAAPRLAASAELAAPKPSWIVALHGKELVPFSWESLHASVLTRGHQQAGQAEIALEDASTYEERLASLGVIVSQRERAALLAERIREIETSLDANVAALPQDLALASAQVEQPVPGPVAIHPKYLELPEWVLSAALGRASGFFLLIGRGSRLLPQVLGVFEAGETPEQGALARGLATELAQAAARYAADREVPLTQHVTALNEQTFHPRLGSLADKTERLKRLVLDLGYLAELPSETVRAALSAAPVCAADRATQIVARYPELQGVAGREYALEQGSRLSSAELLNEYHEPRQIGGPVPGTPAAALLGLADRLDNLVGYWAINATPAGRVDPLDSRGDAIGLLRIVIEYGWPLSFEQMAASAFAGFEDLTLDLDEAETARKLGGYLRHRLRSLLLTDYPRDVVDPCFEAGADVPSELASRTRIYAEGSPDIRAAIAAAFSRLAAELPTLRVANEPTPRLRAVGAEMAAPCRDLVAALEAASAEGRDPEAALVAIAPFVPRLLALLDVAAVSPLPQLAISWLGQVHRSVSEWVRFEGLGRLPPSPSSGLS